MQLKLTSVGEIIAERKYALRSDSGQDSEVSVLLGKPQPFADSADYYCPCQIKGIGEEKVKYFGGVDAFQALDCTLRALGTELEVLRQTTRGRLSWTADKSGSLGFPVSE